MIKKSLDLKGNDFSIMVSSPVLRDKLCDLN